MDSGIKLFVAIVLGITPFFIDSYTNFLLLVAYLTLATALSGIKISVIGRNLVAYAIIIIFPYAFGLLIAFIVSKITGADIAGFYHSVEEVGIRLFQLFVLWYAGSLYFNSTPTESVIGLFDKLLSPLKRIGVPVSDFLKVIMCVVNELKELAPEVKKSFSESMVQLGGKGLNSKRVTGISNILVAFIVNSFQRLGRVEEYVKQVESEDILAYKFSISKNDVLMVLSLLLLIGSMILTSKLGVDFGTYVNY